MKANYVRIFMLLVCVLLLVGTMIYFRPLSANSVFPDLENAEKISFNVRFDEKKDSEFLGAEIKGKELEHFINLLNMTEYRRAFGRANIQSQVNAYDIVVVHNSNNYSMVLNDKGYVVVDVKNTKKKFKILSSKNDTLLKLVDEMVLK